VRYFNDSENQETQDDASDDLIYKGYKAVLDSKSKDETLVTLVTFFLTVKLNISKVSVFCDRYHKSVKLNRHCKQVGSQDGQIIGTEFRGGNIK